MWKEGEVNGTCKTEFFDCHCGFKTKLYNNEKWALTNQHYYEGAIVQK